MELDATDSITAKDPGDAFEDVFWSLLRRHYPPEQLVRLPAEMGGDYGIEGFSTDGIAYQCYADRDSVTLRNRTDKQKQKLNTDTLKLQKNAAKLIDALGGVVLHYYFLCVPQMHAAELVAFANARAEHVRKYRLSFIADDFAIRIKVPDDYPAELEAVMQTGAAKATVPTPAIRAEHLALFTAEKPELVEVMDGKLSVLAARSPGVDVTLLRDIFIRDFLAKEQVMEALKQWPETWERIEARRALRQGALELESELSPDNPNVRVLALIDDYRRDLIGNVLAIREEDARRIATGQTGEWIMLCPLRFRKTST